MSEYSYHSGSTARLAAYMFAYVTGPNRRQSNGYTRNEVTSGKDIQSSTLGLPGNKDLFFKHYRYVRA